MHNDNLYKGFEVELFTGSQNNHVGVSDDIEKLVNEFSNFARMPRPILKKVDIIQIINNSTF